MFGYWLIWVSVCAMGGFRFVSCVVAYVSVCVAFVGFNLCRVWVLVCVVGGLQFFWDVQWVVAVANSAELWPWLVRRGCDWVG